MATSKTADDKMAATQSTNKEVNEHRNDNTEKTTTQENKKLITETNDTKNKMKPTNNKPIEAENAGKTSPQTKNPREVTQEQLNQSINKRSRELTTP